MINDKTAKNSGVAVKFSPWKKIAMPEGAPVAAPMPSAIPSSATLRMPPMTTTNSNLIANWMRLEIGRQEKARHDAQIEQLKLAQAQERFRERSAQPIAQTTRSAGSSLPSVGERHAR